ncbi:serine/threonine-protein kinase [Sphaerisporangium sp. NPDC049002]|uniref:serine/threonine-protein kinase n=1 Tax=unclassified Sphaerisporangium TaxID=2630420 RepID=UPI0033DAF80F
MAEHVRILGRYELDKIHLARGGMGEVWGGFDKRLDRRVAVKFIRFPDGVPNPELERRFIHEAMIMAKLDHPGIPAIHDAGSFEDPLRGPRLFLVMQFVEGVTLDHVVDEHGPLPVGWVAAIGAQVAAVLSAAHERSILHRDLKPANLMLCPDGTLKVLDFGLAVLDDPNLSRLTRTGHMLGTASYMPPEQIRAGTLAPQTDLYALACVLHELFTGKRLFTGKTEYSVFEQHVQTAPSSVLPLRPDVPADLDALLLSMLAKRVEDRPADAATVHDRLLPYVTRVGQLPGVTVSGPSPLRMYSQVVGRMLNRPDATGAPAARVIAQPSGWGDTDFSRGDIERARREAMSLVRESRYSQAVDVLATVAEPAGQALGADDPEVLSLRMQLANVLFGGGDYRQAVPEFHRLAADLAKRYTADDERVFQCRMQEATCHAHLGDGALALRLMNDLLFDEMHAYPVDDPRTLELRRQIGELEKSTGDIDSARRTLADLLDDLDRLYGSDHPATVRVRDGLARLTL